MLGARLKKLAHLLDERVFSLGVFCYGPFMLIKG
jgi:hypothetical protein